MPEPLRTSSCSWCDEPKHCGRGHEFSEWARDRLREMPFTTFMNPPAGGSVLSQCYLEQFAERLFHQRNQMTLDHNRRPNELLLPLCAPLGLARQHYMDTAIIITSEVTKPTLRYRERHR